MATRNPAKAGVHHRTLIPVIICMASAIPPKSAPILITLATVSSKQAPHNTQRDYRRRTTAAKPRPVIIPSREHINCTAAIRGKANSAVHSRP